MNYIGMSLYGTNSLYSVGAIENAQLAHIIYPGWALKIYVGKEISDTIIDELICYGTQIQVMPHNINGVSQPSINQPKQKRAKSLFGMFWRFYVATESDANYCIFRDCDSRLNVREKAAVDEWMSTDKACHVMRDHPHHTRWPMLGGMWGMHANAVPILQLLQNWNYFDRYGSDCTFLQQKVWPLIQNSVLIHGIGGKPFPPHEPYVGFVGEIVNNGTKSDCIKPIPV